VAKLDSRVLERTLKHSPEDGSTHWSSRKLVAELGDVSFSAVQYSAPGAITACVPIGSTLPWSPAIRTSTPMAFDLIDLYLKPPTYAAAFCLDEKTVL
jgi:hypothetical protein